MSHELVSDIQELVSRLLSRRDLGQAQSIHAVAGGRNNRAFRVDGSQGTWLLKQYFQDARAVRDRCGTEWLFSEFCWRQGLDWAPQPIARDDQTPSILFEFIEGRRLERDEIDSGHVEQAAAFVSDLNRFRDLTQAKILPNAAESCFSLTEHLDCVNRRVERLTGMTARDTVDQELQDWLASQLVPAWATIRQKFIQDIGESERAHELPLAGRCLSPSDFGFHNALFTPSGKLRFFDFEYAGWDDPAKLVCDFYWQQERPAPRQTKPNFVQILCDLFDDQSLAERVRRLTTVYGVKWCCLVLNEFLIDDQRRREFASTSPVAFDRRREQFERAQLLLADTVSMIDC